MTWIRAIAVLLAPLGLAACGGDSHATKAGTSATSATTAAAKPSAAVSPQRELVRVQAALRTVKSYHVAGTQIAGDGTTALQGDVTASGSVNLTVTQKGATARIIIIGRDVYLRATRAFWVAQKTPAAAAAALAGRWVKAPADKGISQLSAQLAPRTLAHCATVNEGTVRDAGTGSLHGQPVRVLVAVGDQPGSAPGRLFVAARGRALPVRILQTGPTLPGGRQDALCSSDGPDTTRRSDIRLSAFDANVTITAPRHVLDLQTLLQQQQGTTSS